MLRFGLKLDENEINKHFKGIFKEQNALYPSYGYFSGLTSRQWWMDFVKKLCLKQNIYDLVLIEKFAHDLYDEFKTKNCWEKYQGCNELLEKLKDTQIKLGIVSNFDERLEDILKSLGIHSYFNFILTPIKINGYCKPHKEIFKEAYRLGNIDKPQEYIHIGDSYELDFKPVIGLEHRAIIMLHKNYKDTHSFSGLDNQILKNSNLYAENLSDLFDKLLL